MLRTRVRAGAAAGLVLSLLFAGLFTIVGLFDLFVPALTPMLGAPAPVTLRVPYGPRITHDARAGPSLVGYEHARIIVPRGTLLDDGDDDHRAACAYESLRRPPSLARIISYFALYFILCQMLLAYLRRFGQSRVRLLRPQVGLFFLIL